MKTVCTVSELRQLLVSRRGPQRTVGLVPTMGALHAGHLSLIRRARATCDTVCVSIFVNPTQFGSSEDLSCYPRDVDRDLRLCAEAGVDVCFVPPQSEIYPPGFDTAVAVGGLTEVLCGDARRRGPEHFRGVCTVVTKLFNIAQPDIAYFGQKDAQQALVIKKLVADLNIPVRIEVCETVRDPDGLAISSRNARLSAPERNRALALGRALQAARHTVAEGNRSAESVLDTARTELARAGIEPEYLELRSASDLAAVESVNGSTLLAVAARVGNTRLIDNVILGDDAPNNAQIQGPPRDGNR